MYKTFFLVLALVLFGCVQAPPAPPPPFAAKYRKGCLPEAAAMAQGLKEKNIAAQVVIYTYGPPAWPDGHAVAAYLYPPGANQLWVWDSGWGSARVRAFWSDPHGIAKGWGNRTGMLPVHQAEIVQ
jgi:hypothetical protein